MDSKKQAQGIASLGRYGDTTLMHMRPDEVEQLTAISRANGGDITINPKTGMPEAFLGDFFSALAPMAAGAAANYFLPGSGFVAQYATPFVAGAATKAIQGETDPMSLVMGGVGGIGGANLGQSIQNFGGAKAGSAAIDAVDDVAVDTATKGLEAGTDMTKAYATNVPQMPGTQGVSMYTPQGQTFGSTGKVTQNLQPNQFRVNSAPYQPTSVYDQGLAPSFTPERISTPGGYDPFAGGFEPTSAVAEPQGFLTNATDNIKSGIQSITDTIGTATKESTKNYAAAGERLAEEGIGSYLSEVGGGDKFIGGIKTGLPFAGAGYEAYMKDVYAGMPKYEDSAGMYDPTRKLNLGMDTGLRLLSKGGKVAFEEGGVVRDRSYYGIEPQYNTVGYGRPGIGGQITPVNYAPSGPFDSGLVPITARQPVQGFVDVGGKFRADPEGTMTDVDYENRFKYVTEGTKKPEDSDQPFDSLNPTAGGAGINPAMALNLAQGYAESQQSGLEEQGLGQLRKGGTVKYQQGGKTTAEANTAKVSTPPPVGAMEMVLAKKQMEEQGIPAGINVEAIKAQAANAGMNEGGIAQLAQATPDDGKMLNGEGDGVSDDIPAMIEGEQEAALSDGEFIVPARIVSELGNGSSDAGAQKLYSMIDRIQAARKQTIGDDKQYAKDTNAERFLPV
jgi:hypothetical protein